MFDIWTMAEYRRPRPTISPISPADILCGDWCTVSFPNAPEDWQNMRLGVLIRRLPPPPPTEEGGGGGDEREEETFQRGELVLGREYGGTSLSIVVTPVPVETMSVRKDGGLVVVRPWAALDRDGTEFVSLDIEVVCRKGFAKSFVKHARALRARVKGFGPA
jgi:hypothetical protein